MSKNSDTEIDLDENIIDWCTSGEPSDSDRDYADVAELNLDTLPEITVELAKFNQTSNLKTKKACTIVNSTRALLSLVHNRYGYEYEVGAEIDSAIDYCVSNAWYVVGSWWSIPLAVNTVMKWWNFNHPDKKVNYIKMTTWWDFYELLKRGYPLVWSYNGNKTYDIDKSDMTLDNITFWSLTYGHCTILHGDVTCDDSFNGVKGNIYSIKDLNWLIANKVWNGNFYMFTKVISSADTIKKLTNMRSLIQTIIDNNSALRTLSTDKNYKNALHENSVMQREKIAYINNQLKTI